MCNHTWSVRAIFCAQFFLLTVCAWGSVIIGANIDGPFEKFTAEVDFGINTQQTFTSHSRAFNNFTGPMGARPLAPVNLIDNDREPTGVIMTPTWSALNDDVGIAGSAANYEGPYPKSPHPELPQLVNGETDPSAMRDSVYVRDGQSLTLKLSNLPERTIFTFTLYGAAGNTGDYSLFTVTGANSAQAFIKPLVANDSSYAHLPGILPSPTRDISLVFEGRRPDGSPHLANVNNDGLGRLNYLRIYAYELTGGDYNLDGRRTTLDYDAWRASFGSTTNLAADGNRNGIVDAADFVIWRNIFWGPRQNAASFSSSVVPEPAALVLLSVAALGFCVRRQPHCRRS